VSACAAGTTSSRGAGLAWDTGDLEHNWQGYFIPGTPVLRNRVGAHTLDELRDAENDLVEARVIELRETPDLLGDRTYDGGAAAGLGSTLGGILGAAKNLLNSITYYQMKARAGTVGEHGLAPLVTQIRNDRSDLRIHLVGHSFGGRLVSAAASQLPKDGAASMTLLQAAFSHYGFAELWSPGHAGGFRSAITNGAVAGPIVITHTANDTSVGIAFAIASRIAGQNASAVGTPTTPTAVSGATAHRRRRRRSSVNYSTSAQRIRGMTTSYITCRRTPSSKIIPTSRVNRSPTRSCPRSRVREVRESDH